jgi:hypothetical protein
LFARLAALRLVLQALIVKEHLFACRPGEFFTAVHAFELPIFVF